MSENNGKANSEIGYGKPPKDTRFRNGVSGNPAGRPRGVPNLTTVLYRVLREKVVINENGVAKVVTNQEAIIRQLIGKAKSGDLVAMRLEFNLEAKAEAMFSGGLKTRIDDTNQLPIVHCGTVSDSDVYVVPNAVCARQTAAIIKLIHGIDIPGAYPIMIMSEQELKELALRVRKAYGFPVTEDEVLQLANDGLLIEAAEAEAGRRPKEP
jgi:hypothetical protein